MGQVLLQNYHPGVYQQLHNRSHMDYVHNFQHPLLYKTGFVILFLLDNLVHFPSLVQILQQTKSRIFGS